MLSHLKRSINLASLENGTYDQKVAHLDRELELNDRENDGELPIPSTATTEQSLNFVKNIPTNKLFGSSFLSAWATKYCLQAILPKQFFIINDWFTDSLIPDCLRLQRDFP